MIRHFCDGCNREMTPEAQWNESKDAKGRTLAVKNVNNGSTMIIICVPPDICKYCVIDSVNALDDRPRAGAGDYRG